MNHLFTSCALSFLLLISSLAHSQPTLRNLGRIINIDSLGDMQVYGDYAYVVSAPPRGKLTIKIIDASNPSHPKIAGEYISSASSYSCFEGCPPHQMQLAWPLIYLPVGDGLEIVNVEDVNNPTVAGKFPLLNNYANMGVVNVENSIALWAPKYGDTYLLDVEEPSLPQLLSVINLALITQKSLFVVQQAILQFPYVFVLCDTFPETFSKIGGDSILCMDIGNPSKPIIGGLVAFPLSPPRSRINEEPVKMVKKENWLYLHIGNDGFYKVDVTNPMQPVVQPSTKYPQTIYDLHLQDNYLFAATGTRLSVFELQNGDPIFLSEINRSGYGVVASDKFILAKIGYPSILQTFELLTSSAVLHAEQYP